MLAHCVVSIATLAALLASYSGIYHDASQGVMVLACVNDNFNINFIVFFTDSHWFSVHCSMCASIIGIVFYLIDVSCALVRLFII
jgi:hypothetical protein